MAASANLVLYTDLMGVWMKACSDRRAARPPFLPTSLTPCTAEYINLILACYGMHFSYSPKS